MLQNILNKPEVINIIYGLMIVIFAILNAYILNFQNTTFSIGKQLAPTLTTGFQDIITPKIQERGIEFMVLSSIIIFVLGWIFYKWYLAILFLFLSLLILPAIFSQFMPKKNSIHYCRIIRKHLIKNLNKYKAQNDKEKIAAISIVLKRFDNLYNI